MQRKDDGGWCEGPGKPGYGIKLVFETRQTVISFSEMGGHAAAAQEARKWRPKHEEAL